MARAKYLVNNVNLPDDIVKRPGSVTCMTHHGTPLKLMGIDQALTPPAATARARAQMRERVDRWDYSVAANPFSTEGLGDRLPVRLRALENGYPRNDVLALRGHRRARRPGAGDAGHRAGPDRVVLYAPTHRGAPPALRASCSTLARWPEALGPDTRDAGARALLLRADRPLGRGRARPGSGDVSTYPGVEDLYLAADVLITDYSSTMFDYAMLDRPIAVYAADWAAYRRSRGAYFDIAETHPGAVATTQDELVALFTSGAVDGTGDRQRRAAFRERFCALEDGRAAERVVRRVLLGEQVEHGPAAAPRVPRQATRPEAPTSIEQPALS